MMFLMQEGKMASVKGWGRAWSRNAPAGTSLWQARKVSGQRGAKNSHEAAVDQAGGMRPWGSSGTRHRHPILNPDDSSVPLRTWVSISPS